MLLADHVLHNNIFTIEQAGERKGTWGTTKQVLINKSILKEVNNSRRNLVTVWLNTLRFSTPFPIGGYCKP